MAHQHPPDSGGDASDADASDAEAIIRSRHEPAAFADIFHRHFTAIHGYAARRLGTDAADDVAAETFLAAFRKRGRFDPARGTVATGTSCCWSRSRT
ncbi:RNA polymerase sigma factor [Spirillospora albida]|uniref:RNA polymerase sigma factor n=1 Tax=Spirillospora albida TaxID=58123 RepID=UPI0004C15CAA|nr:sigma factor [Spirillospora albida]